MGVGGESHRGFSLLSKLTFMLDARITFLKVKKKKKKESCTQSVLRFVGWPQTSQLCQSSCDPS